MKKGCYPGSHAKKEYQNIIEYNHVVVKIQTLADYDDLFAV